MSDPIPEPAVPAGDNAAAPEAPQVPEPAVPEATVEAAPAQAVADTPTEPAAPAVPELSPTATAALLLQHFPALFTPGQAKPIKLRIQADIQLRLPGVFTKKSLSLFLHRHTTSTAYLRSLVSSPQRFDLDGAPAGEVAAEHRDAATVEVERRRAIVMAKRQAERQAQRPPRAAPEGAVAVQPAQPGQPRPDRADRPPRPERPNRPDRPPRNDRPPQTRHDRPPRPQRPEGPAQQQQQQQQQQRPPREAAPAPMVDPAVAALSAEEQAGRRDRALLLRAWETSTLTRANFCALKRISEADLEAQLAQARQERPAHVGVKPAR
jgi:ProP effector